VRHRTCRFRFPLLSSTYFRAEIWAVGLRSTNGEKTDESFYQAVLAALLEAGVNPTHPFWKVVTCNIQKSFADAGAEVDLKRLQHFGVFKETLFVAMFLFGLLPTLDVMLKDSFGDMKDRRRKERVLREAAAIMEEYGKTGELAERLSQGHNIKDPIPPTKGLAEALHYYANILFMREQMLDALDANSGTELAKYAIASAVKRITGKYHDREVSAVLGVYQCNPDYDETAHRVWRIRTVARLDSKASFFPVFLHALNTALQQSSIQAPGR
jgi:hypothetical protein